MTKKRGAATESGGGRARANARAARAAAAGARRRAFRRALSPLAQLIPWSGSGCACNIVTLATIPSHQCSLVHAVVEMGSDPRVIARSIAYRRRHFSLPGPAAAAAGPCLSSKSRLRSKLPSLMCCGLICDALWRGFKAQSSGTCTLITLLSS